MSELGGRAGNVAGRYVYIPGLGVWVSNVAGMYACIPKPLLSC